MTNINPNRLIEETAEDIVKIVYSLTRSFGKGAGLPQVRARLYKFFDDLKELDNNYSINKTSKL